MSYFSFFGGQFEKDYCSDSNNRWSNEWFATCVIDHFDCFGSADRRQNASRWRINKTLLSVGQKAVDQHRHVPNLACFFFMADSCRFCGPHKFISHLNRYTVYIQIYSSDYDDRLSVLTMYYIVADRYFLCFDCFGGRNSWLMFHLCLMASGVSFDRSGSFQSSGKGTRLDAERSCFVFVSLFKEGTTKDWTTF